MSRVASELLRFFVGSSSQAGNAASQASSSAHAGAGSKPIPVAEPRAAAEPRPERQQSKVGKSAGQRLGLVVGCPAPALSRRPAEAGLSPETLQSSSRSNRMEQREFFTDYGEANR